MSYPLYTHTRRTSTDFGVFLCSCASLTQNVKFPRNFAESWLTNFLHGDRNLQNLSRVPGGSFLPACSDRTPRGFPVDDYSGRPVPQYFLLQSPILQEK